MSPDKYVSTANLDRHTDHRPWSDLLPWYVNGTLDGREQSDVEEHLHACLVCRRELAELRGLRDAVQGADDPALAPARGFERLMTRIDAGHAPPVNESVIPAAAQESFRVAVRRLFAGLHPAVRWTLIGQSALLVVLAGTLVVGTQRGTTDGAAGFRTLSDGSVYLPGERALLSVVFAPTASDAERRQAVDSVGANVLAGPNEAGAVTVAINAPTRYSTPMSAAAVDALRAHPAVVSAEPLGVDRSLTNQDRAP